MPRLAGLVWGERTPRNDDHSPDDALLALKPREIGGAAPPLAAAGSGRSCVGGRETGHESPLCRSRRGINATTGAVIALAGVIGLIDSSRPWPPRGSAAAGHRPIRPQCLSYV